MLQLEQLDLLFSSTSLEGPEQMALDELLFRQLQKPLLRVYKWKAPCITFGYFQKYSEVKHAFPNDILVRRSTGGGCVEHRNDLTFSLMIPSSESLRAMPPLLFYKQLHEVVMTTLREFKITSHLANQEETFENACCFAAPALYDLLVNGKKILGGAQRRSLGALLYQGSLLLPIAEDTLTITREDGNANHFFQHLAAHLTENVTIIEEDSRWLKEATIIAKKRYRSHAWTHKR